MAERLPHDQRIAYTNHLMREVIDPTLPPGHGAVLIVFETGVPNGMLCYISNARREEMREVLRKLLDKWDADAAAKESSSPR